jgi:hypothetical protein
VRHRAAEDKAARLDPRHLVDAGAHIGLNQPVNRDAQRARIPKQGCDVAKHHTRPWVVRHGANRVFEIHICGSRAEPSWFVPSRFRV